MTSKSFLNEIAVYEKSLFCHNSLQFKKIALPLHRFSSPDGGIGRRAGLKHQWGNTRAGSTPALGTGLKAQGAESQYDSAPCFISAGTLLENFCFSFHEKLILFEVHNLTV